MSLLLKFKDIGYDLCDLSGEKLYSDSGSYANLLNFIDADLSELPILLAGCINTNRDIDSTNDDSGYTSDYCLSRIHEILCSIHPFFECYMHETISDAVADFFIISLLQNTIQDDYSFSETYDFETFSRKLTKLLPHYYFDEVEEVKKHFNQYLKHIHWETDFPQATPVPFGKLIANQEYLRALIFWVLDKSIPILYKLTLNERIALFGELFPLQNDMPHTSITKRLSLTNPHQGNKISYFPYGISNFGDSIESLDDDTKDYLLQKISEIKGAADGFFEEYEISSIFDLLFIEIENMIKTGTWVKRCRHCRNYFVVKNMNTAYCSRPTVEDSDKTCADIGSDKAFQQKLKNDPQLLTYNRAYKKYFNRVKLLKTMSQSEFNSWQKTAREKFDAFRSGAISLDEFNEWFGVKDNVSTKKTPK